ncbi:hypothetical protein EIK77_001552 [Talaromyces pinophilus]|nr:hypothetical protein EIK77_001552 [Talaromyces pinophilus]
MDSIVIEDIPSNSQQILEERDWHCSSVDEAAAAPLNQQAQPKTGAKTAFGVGYIMNLMSFDVDAIESARDIVLVAVAVPTEVMIATGFLYTLIGWSAISGLVAMVFTLALPAYFSHKMVSIQQNAMKYTDKRISKVSEYLNAIRVIKYFGWEEAVAHVIQKIRKLEQREIYKRNLCAIAVVWSGDFIPLFSLFIMFTTYVLGTGQPLRPDTAFTCLAVVETLRQQFIWVSNVSGFVSQAAVSLQRLDRFFQGMVPVTKVVDDTPSFKHASFIRCPDSGSQFCLQGLHFSFLPGRLNVVTGPTGSGKTTLLLSLLGETILVSGRVKCDSNAAYVSQTPWLQSGTIRDNIVFHSNFDRTRYEAAVEACGLVSDFHGFPKGDLTEIAEQGSSLSGGQRLRVVLARAIYSSASTLLLDDIFSCLDVHTVNHIFNKVFRNRFLGKRTVILVSHLSPVIDAADLLVHLEHGRVISVDVRDPLFKSVNGAPVTTPESLAKPLSGQMERDVQFLEESRKTTKRSEHMLDGRIPLLKYMSHFGGLPYTILALFTAFLTQITFLSIPLWLSQWTGAYAKTNVVDVSFYLGIYACVLLGFNLMVVINNLVFQHGNWKAAHDLHARLTSAVLNSPIKWFDYVPTGMILNRFSQDIQSLDSILLNWLRMSLDNQLRLLLRISSIASILPIFALPAVILCMIGFVVGEIYTRSQISIKRLTSATRSPIFSHFSETLIGLPTIRAQKGVKEIFGLILADHLRDNSRAYEALYNSNRWVSVRADAVAASISAAAGIIAIMKSDTISPGLVGFSLTNAIGLSQTILTMVRNMNELEVELNSFQRVAEFTSLPSEEASVVERSTRAIQSPPAGWPSRGEVEFSNFSASYGPNGPDVLKGISLRIRPGERIGVVGRTGSSKSTLALSILRFTHKTSGFLFIDGIDAQSLPLKDLRRAVTIIPQDSTIFSGDLRSNLDPFGKMEDTELNSILRSCSIIGANESDNKRIVPGNSSEEEEVSSSSADLDLGDTRISLPCKQPLSLSTPVAIGGSNFSKGERQTLCLARAVCRRSKIIIVDEATSSVDSRTDAMIQNVLRTEFIGSTVLTIAHRLETVIDYDRILVMSAGEIVELDTPRNLLDRRGLFWNMVKESGKMNEMIALAK